MTFHLRPPAAHWGTIVLLVAVLALVPAIPTAAADGHTATDVAVALGSIPSDSRTTPPPAPSPPVGFPPGSGANSSGPGMFYTSRALPSPSFANETCTATGCYNVSNDVATNYTSKGVLVAAYTSLTDRSPCATQRAFSVSNIAFVTSANLGQTWSHVRYLGNTVCSGLSLGYSDAWEPSLTSLSNGTIVLAYVEYNLTAGALPPLTPASWPPVQSRLVLTESYDNGIVWTVPTVLNISNPVSAPPGIQYTPAFPSVAAIGDTIYATWMSLTSEDSEGAIALMVSTDGGHVWSPTVPVSTGFGADYSMNPQALVEPSGQLEIAYVSNITFNFDVCGDDAPFGCVYYSNGVWAGTVWVASSTTNGTAFNYSVVSTCQFSFCDQIALDGPGWGPAINPTSFGPFQTPMPQLAYSAATSQLYVAFAAGRVANASFFGCFDLTTSCLVGGLYFYASANNGSSWTPGNIRTVVFDPDLIDPSSQNLNATDTVTSVSIAVTGGGAVDVEASFYNGSTCFSGTCGAATEVVFSTPDNGTTFTQPVVVAAAYTPMAYAWNGEYGSVEVLGGAPLFFWASNTCPAWQTTPCGGYPASPYTVAQVELSTLFTGVGTSLFFNATGLGPTVNWSVDVLGNYRTGNGSATLSVSGVPDGIPILWAVQDVNLSTAHYVVAGSTTSPPSPQSLSGTLGVVVAFLEYVPVSVSYTVPSVTGIACGAQFDLGTCPTFYPLCSTLGGQFAEDFGCFSVYFTPVPPVGEQWLPMGQPVSLGLTPTPLDFCGVTAFGFCFLWVYNLTLLGWSGTGPGSVSSSQTNITFAPDGPVTEHASFVMTGVCNYEYDNFFSPPLMLEYCDTFTAPLTVEEHGLPAGTSWGVTFSGAAGTGSVVATAPESIENASAGVGFAGISVWNVPSANPAEIWQGIPNVGSTVLLPYISPVTVNYTLVPLAGVSVPLEVRAAGLPTGLGGNLSITDLATSAVTSFSVGGGGVNESVTGGSYLINASSIVTTSGVSYLVAEIYVDSSFMNNSNQSALSPATVLIGGATIVTVAYGTENWVQVSAGTGGQASPASRWVTAGSTITLRATPNAGYHFLYWVGTGPGSTSGPQASLSQVVIQPAGPVTELATFAPIPASTWTVTVSPSGLPGGVEYSVTVGTTTYSGTGTFSIANLSTGVYTTAFPSTTGVGAAITQYVLTSVTASAGLTSNQLNVNQNLTLFPVYATTYFVSIAVVGNGALSLGPGSYWESAGSTLTVVSTPASGWLLEDWTGSFDSATPRVLSNFTTLSTTLTGSLNVVAQFVAAPPVPTPTYALTVNESGLPTDTPWQFGLAAGAGVEGPSVSLTIAGLSGVYPITVPTVYTAPGVRFVPAGTTNTSVRVDSNMSMTVTFDEQFLVTVAASGPGSASGGGWYGLDQTVSLTATAAGAAFAGWQGSGPGSYSGTSLAPTFTATGPVTETATFSNTATSGSSTPTTPILDYVVIGLVVALLLVIGAAEGFVAGRRRRPPSGGPASSTAIDGETAPPRSLPGPGAEDPAARSATWAEN